MFIGAMTASASISHCIIRRKAEDVSVGILCDTTRYATDDPVEWEVFRTHMLEHQGWRIHRVWTPHFFRDPQGCLTAIQRDIDLALEAERENAQRAAEAAAVAAQTPTTAGSNVKEIIARRKKAAKESYRASTNAAATPRPQADR